KKDARIIIVNMYEGKGRKLACSAYNNDKDGTWYKKVVWLFPSFYDRHWMDVNDTACGCTQEQIRQVIGRYFAVSSQTICKQKDYLTENGLSPTQFKKEFSGTRLYNMLKSEIPKEFEDYYQTFFSDGSVYNEHRAPEAYDAVWAIAMALNNTLTNLTESGDVNGLENFNYHNETLLKIMRDSMQKVRFNSLSCEFFFNNNGDRIPGIEIYQFKNDNASGFELLGQCHFNGSDGQWNCSLNESKIVWDSGVRPVDETKNKNVTKNIDVYMRNGFWILASFGMTMSAGLLVFNVCNKCHRIVKMSSPRLNNIILLGCMISYSTIYIMDVKEEVTCILRTFTVILSFSLSFGALFAKTWRVYEIFTAGHKVLNTRMLRDSSLFLIVAILVVINSSVLVAWMIISPQMPTFVNIGTTPECAELLACSVEKCAELLACSVEKCAELLACSVEKCAERLACSVEKCAELLDCSVEKCAELFACSVEKCAELLDCSVEKCAKLLDCSVEKCAKLLACSVEKCAELFACSVEKCAELLDCSVEKCAELLACSVEKCAELLDCSVEKCAKLLDCSVEKCAELFAYSVETCAERFACSVEKCTKLLACSVEKCAELLACSVEKCAVTVLNFLLALLRSVLSQC
ncbi:gamma-aminobutyric acid type B receptor subunit 2, partial [Biomphalaria glabrata]